MPETSWPGVPSRGGLYGIYETYELNGSEVFPDLNPVGTSSCSSGTPDLIRSESPNR
jgi:hypothetical protein